MNLSTFRPGRMTKLTVRLMLPLCLLLALTNVTVVRAAVVINTDIYCWSGMSNPSLSTATPISSAGGAYLLVGVRTSPSAAVSIADTMGSSYTLVNTSQNSGGQVKTNVYLAALPRDMNNTTDRININTSNYDAHACAIVIGGLEANPLDGSAIGSNNWSTAMSTAAVTPTTANSLLVGVFGWDSNSYDATPGSGWTEQKEDTLNQGAIQIETRQVSGGSHSATATLNYTDRWAGVVVALKVSPPRPPTDITLSNNTIMSTNPPNTLVGTLAAIDPDTGETYIFSLVSGSGDTHNSSFTITGNELHTNASLTPGAYSIRVNVYDGTYNFAKVFTITVTAPQSPTDITLSDNTIASSDPPNTLVGTLTAVDPDVGETYTFTLVSGTGDTHNSSFTITGNELRTNASLAPGDYSIRVNVTDGANDFPKVFTITVTAYPTITANNTDSADIINQITFGTINNTSGSNTGGYGDYSAQSTTLNPGASAGLSVYVGSTWVDATYQGSWSIKVFFDWNQDFDFSDPGEGLEVQYNIPRASIANPGFTAFTKAITVPAGATPGNTRMRVVYRWQENLNEDVPSSGNFGYGEAEDYTINVAQSEPTNYPTGFGATTNSASQVTTSWTDSTGGTAPNGYLVLCNTSGSFTSPTDGAPQSDDTNCADGSGVRNVAQGVGAYAWTGLNGNTTYYYRIFPYTNSGSNINYKTDGTPPTANALTPKAEPTNHPTGFGATANSASQVTTSWTDSTGGTVPDGYLVLCNTSGSFTSPTDGAPQSDDTNCADGSGVRNVAQGTGTYAWTGLNPGTQYFFRIFPYANSGSQINYKTDGTPGSANATTISLPEIAVLGNNAVINDGDTTPSAADHTDFGSVMLGGAITRTFTISNSGGQNLNLTGAPLVSISGAAVGDFTVVSSPTTPLLPGATTTFQVRFDPSVVGARAATVTIDNNDNNENPYDFAIQGTGTLPEVNLSVNTGSGSEAAGTVITVTATASANVSGTQTVDVGVSGAGITAGDYGLSNATITIPDGQNSGSVTLTVQDDWVDEDAETAALTLGNPSAGLTLGSVTSQNVSIADNDTAGVTLSKTGVAVVEGGATDTYTVRLDTQPLNSVTVRITPTAQLNLGAGAGTPINLTFDGTNWITLQTVTASAVDDTLIEGNHTSSLSHGASSADAKYNGIAVASVTAALTDNDLGYTLSANQSTVNEGNTGSTSITFTVQRTGAITTEASSVNFSFSGAASLGSDYTQASPAGSTLNFAAGTIQANLVLNVLGDYVDEDNETIDVTLSNPTASGTASILGSNPVSTTISDDDTADFTVSAISGNTSEDGTQATFTVRLNSQPTAGVTISLDSNDLTEGTVAPSSLTFTALTWSAPQTATVTGVDDFVTDGNMAYTLVTIGDMTTADAFYRGLDPANVAALNLDNDTPRVNIVQSGGSTAAIEGGSGDTYTVVLNSQPTDPVTITVAPDAQLNLGAGAGAPITLTFAAGSWNAPQTVTIIAFDDAIVEGNHSGGLNHSAGSADPNYGSGVAFAVDGVAGSSVTAALTDNDIQYTLSANQATVTEGNTGAQSIIFTVTRTGDITRSSSVDWSLSGAAISGTDYAVGSPASATVAFGAGVTTQLVTLNVLGDYVDESDETIIVTLSNPTGTGGGGTGSASGGPATTTIQDDDTAGVSASPVSLTVSEPNTTGVFTIGLTSQPTADVTITLISTDTTECSVPALAVLNSGNWQTGVAITVAAVDDLVSDGPQTCLVQTGATSSSDPNYDGLAVADVTVTVNDDDVPSVILSKTSVSAGEGGPNDTYIVRLRTVPVAAVTVSFNAGSQLQAIGPLTFAADLSAVQPQTVTVEAVDDGTVEGNHSATISHTVASADPAYNTPGVPFSPANLITVNIADNDVAYAVAASVAAALEGNTGSTPITFTLIRSGGVTTTASSVDLAWSGAATQGSDYTVSPSDSTINFGAGQSEATVIVSVSGDFVAEPDEVITLTLTNPTGPGAEYITTGSAQAVITNDDTAGITVGPTSLTVSEPNATGVFTIGLNSQPTADVTITLISTDTTECSVPASVSLNAGNWRVVSVTVTAVDDSIADSQQICVVQTSAAASGDPNYAGRNPADVTVAVNDNDSPGIAVSPFDGVTTEQGGSFNLTVMLQTQPAAVVTLTLVSTDTTEGIVSPALLIFTPSDWNVARVVTVTGVNDDVDDDDAAYTIQIDNPTTSDPVYAAINPADARVVNLDDDTAGIVVSAISGNTSEIGAPATFTLVLTSQPVATVTIPFTSSDLTEGTVSPTSVTSTPANWNMPQTITVTGVDDPVFDGGVAYSIQVGPASSSDQKYNGLDPVDVEVVNLDDDRTFIYLPLVMRNYVAAPDLVVQRIIATSNNIQVVIKNQGDAPVNDEFWVDVYLNPDVAPTHVNQTWDMLGRQGLAWGLTPSALPALTPGGVLTLTLTDEYYLPDYSNVSWPLPFGTPVYAQVDSADALTAYGAVLENHEIIGGLYSNILGPVYVTSAATTSGAPQAPAATQDSGHLPPRP